MSDDVTGDVSAGMEPDTTTTGLHDVLRAATAAADLAAESDPGTRARWLRAVADALDAAAPVLVPLARRESRLPDARLAGELARTTAQLRLFASVALEGSCLEATIDHPDPEGVPPVPDLRRMLVPLGVVAVFAASNFPFAFSVAGGDTASALAVGNAVVVKAYPGHLELSRATAEVVVSALDAAGAPSGLFAVVEGFDTGVALVEHPAVRAVGFTGSVPGGRALFDRAARRPDPIPFHGELGSLNPVVVTRGALSARGPELAAGLAASFTLGAGQFCTKPGLVAVPASSEFDAALVAAVPEQAAPMLTPGIRAGFAARAAQVLAVAGVRVLTGRPPAGSGGDDGPVLPLVVEADVATVLGATDMLLEEAFGPLTVLVRYADEGELAALVAALPGSLTATIHAEGDEDVDGLVRACRAVAGRVLFEGWPTGVAVSWAQHHGGPYPATTSQHTSVGATATRRWLRPVAYQDAPQHRLPPPLRDHDPWGVVRRVDGVLQVPAANGGDAAPGAAG
ncbi:aldehyde dehydrogenase (NADP(+)) [Isoptericola sp. NPDC019693]|uniref:aldehyde dehydrogenase (NADP(+)) n=1 Tax=Isoptericola sp. NPDC019693 TaxID=3364009 RepID=UPI0037BAEC45